MGFIQDAFYFEEKSIIYMYLAICSLENLEITKYCETIYIMLNNYYRGKIKYLLISSIENVGIFLILVGGDVGRKGGLNTA